VTSIFTDSEGLSVLKNGGLENLANFDFQNHIMFYVLLLVTMLVVLGVIYGFVKDRFDLKYWSGIDIQNSKEQENGKKDVNIVF
jgi:hypothetical protein